MPETEQDEHFESALHQAEEDAKLEEAMDRAESDAVDPDLEQALAERWEDETDDWAILRAGASLKGRYVAGVDLNHPERWHLITEVHVGPVTVGRDHLKAGLVLLAFRDGYRLYAETDRVATMSPALANELNAEAHQR